MPSILRRYARPLSRSEDSSTCGVLGVRCFFQPRRLCVRGEGGKRTMKREEDKRTDGEGRDSAFDLKAPLPCFMLLYKAGGLFFTQFSP